MSERRPCIGVSGDRVMIDPHPSHVSGEKYLRAVIDGASSLPLIVPALADGIEVDDVLTAVDGILLTGSYSNIEPQQYGADPAGHVGRRDPHRDAMTLPLAVAALQRGVPMLAVCRGFQELAVAIGGSLHAVVAEVPGLNNHLENKADPRDVQYGPSHPILLREGGLLRQLAGSDSVMVNSLHGQGVDRLPDNARIEAVAEDGLVEAFCVADTPGFNLAVQWHPEWKVTENEFSMAIFGAFGDACRAAM